MNKRGYLFLVILSTAPAIVTVFIIFYATVFADATLADFFGGDLTNLTIVLVLFSAVGLMLSALLFPRAREEVLAATTLKYAPELKEMVKAITKTTQALDSLTSIATFVIAFEFPNNVRKIVEVDTNQYSIIAEGDVGILTYKQNKDNLFFVSFEPLH